MRFCRECNNLLYPRENRLEKRLEFVCKLCPYVDTNEEGSSCVWANELLKDSSSTLDVISSDMKNDPTLQRSSDIECPKCGYHEAVFFQQTSKSTALRLIFICCARDCKEKWEG
ncbi:unnamed protein product [Ectocarpus fasciculatus]